MLEPDVLVLLPQSFSSYNTIPYQTDWYKEWRDYCLCCCSCSNEALNIEHDTYFARQHKIREASLEMVTHRIMWVFRLNFYMPPRSVVYLLTLFFDTCQERWFLWREGDRLEEIKRYTGLESADGVRPMDQENMLWRCWFVRSGARPMESCRWSRGRRRGSGLSTRILTIRL